MVRYHRRRRQPMVLLLRLPATCLLLRLPLELESSMAPDLTRLEGRTTRIARL